MSISAISSTIQLSDVSHPLRNRIQEFKQDFEQLGKDLQSGDMSAAKSDLSALMQVMPQSNSVTPGAVSSNPIAQGFHQLAVDLQNGNVSAAQQDYSKLEQAIDRRAAGVRHSHNSGSGDKAEISQLFQQLGSALQSGDTSRAQQMFAALQQQLGKANAENASAPLTPGISLTV